MYLVPCDCGTQVVFAVMPVNTQIQAILKITVTGFLLVYGPSSFYRQSSYLSTSDFLQISERQHLSSNVFKNSLVFPFSSFFLFFKIKVISSPFTCWNSMSKIFIIIFMSYLS